MIVQIVSDEMDRTIQNNKPITSLFMRNAELIVYVSDDKRFVSILKCTLDISDDLEKCCPDVLRFLNSVTENPKAVILDYLKKY